MTRYLLLLGICMILTLPLEFIFHARVYRRFLKALQAIWLPSLVYLIWDYFATKNDHWSFSSKHTVDFKLFGLPIEEILFFLIVPLCALLTFEAVSYLLKKPVHANPSAWFGYIVLMIGAGLGVSTFRTSNFDIIYPNRIFPYYTLATLLICVFVFEYCRINSSHKKLIRSQTYFLTIAICLFFMIFINGFLTILDDPVVSYRANLGPRLFLDIPIEDFFYGTALLTWILIRWSKITNSKSSSHETRITT